MNRRKFLKNIFLALPLLGAAKLNANSTVRDDIPAELPRGSFVFGKSAAKHIKQEDGKFGFVHIKQMPEGIRPGDIRIIDNETGKHIKFDERDGYIDDGKYIFSYNIEYFDDRTGLIGGCRIMYENYDSRKGLGREMHARSFYEIRDFSVKIDKSRPWDKIKK